MVSTTQPTSLPRWEKPTCGLAIRCNSCRSDRSCCANAKLAKTNGWDVLPRKLYLTLHHEKVRVARISRAQGYQRPLPDPLPSSRTWRMLLLDRRGRIHDRRIECTSDTLTAPYSNASKPDCQSRTANGQAK